MNIPTLNSDNPEQRGFIDMYKEAASLNDSVVRFKYEADVSSFIGDNSLAWGLRLLAQEEIAMEQNVDTVAARTIQSTRTAPLGASAINHSVEVAAGKVGGKHTKLPSVKPARLIRALERAGFEKKKRGQGIGKATHVFMHNPETGARTTVVDNRKVDIGEPLLRKIAGKASMTAEELLEFL
jgi:predicted RNA binding protein YcfA (HicA-like mRNA interferase family)